jgi:glycine oxidase
MLAPATEVHPGEDSLLALNLVAAERYPSFVADLERASSRDVGYRACGTLVVARDADEKAALDDLYALQRSLDLSTERLSGAACRELEPGLTPRVRAGILVAGDHQVDSRALVEALHIACHERGVNFAGSRAVEITSQRGAVTGVVLADGRRLPSEHVVLCAGCWSPALEGLPEGPLPVRPVKGQLLHLRVPAGSPLLGRSIRGGGVHGVYLVPRVDGRVVVGATVEEQGFDQRATAGAVLTLLDEAYGMFPGLAEAELTEISVGLRPGSPDNAPLIGPLELDGLFVATGHYRNGILLASVTADAIVGLLMIGEAPDEVKPFSPARFRRAPAEAASWN